MKPLLKYHEIREKLQQIARGQIDREALQKLDLHSSDLATLEQALPVATPKWGSTAASHNDELGRIAAAIQTKLQGSDLNDPVGFLLHGDLNSLCVLLGEADFNTVVQYRTRHNHNTN
jgi:hypothetical protein